MVLPFIVLIILALSLIVFKSYRIATICTLFIFYKAVTCGISYANDIETVKQLRENHRTAMSFEQQLIKKGIHYKRNNDTFTIDYIYEVQY